MAIQGNSYLSNSVTINPKRSFSSNKTLGDRPITSNIINGKRYFSSIDAEIYFGGLENQFIDDIVQISWSVEQAVMPIFGYNSYTFDDVAIGARQVSGMFTINFTKSGFLYDVLRSIESVNRANFYEHKPDNSNINWASIFEKEHLPAWDKSFNIIIGYGDYKQGGTNTTMTLLYCVQITGCQQVLNPDGTPIGEAYSFIAKDTRFEINNLPQTAIKDTTIDILEESFIFNVDEGYIDLLNNISVLNLKYKKDNGEIKKIFIKIKDYKHNILVNKIIDISQIVNNGSYEFDAEITQMLDKNLNMQKSANLKEYYIYIDFKIEYTNDTINSYYYNVFDQKITINKK